MQLICRNDIEEFANWKEAFDADNESRMQAGLTVLQLWQDADDSNRDWISFGVNDRDRAQACTENLRSEQVGKRAGVTDSACQFVETL